MLGHYGYFGHPRNWSTEKEKQNDGNNNNLRDINSL